MPPVPRGVKRKNLRMGNGIRPGKTPEPASEKSLPQAGWITMGAANRQESYRPVEDQPIGKEHWEHERSPALTECEERSQVGNRGSVSCQKTSSATMAGRRRHARFARVAKPPMALPVGFAEMPKADVVSYLCVPLVVHVSPTVSLARCRITLQWESKTCLLEHRRFRAERACTRFTQRSRSAL